MQFKRALKRCKLGQMKGQECLTPKTTIKGLHGRGRMKGQKSHLMIPTCVNLLLSAGRGYFSHGHLYTPVAPVRPSEAMESTCSCTRSVVAGREDTYGVERRRISYRSLHPASWDTHPCPTCTCFNSCHGPGITPRAHLVVAL